MSDKPKTIPNPVKFAFGGLAGCGATCFVQPLDLVKNRMQMSAPGQFKSGFHCMRSIIAAEGPAALYTGLSAGLLRQCTYTTTRLGVFNTLMDSKKGPNGEAPSLAYKALFGLTAGAIGSVVGTPAEVCLIRMSSDGRLPPAERRNYTSVGNALVRIVKEEGILTLWKGVGPTVGRAMVLNMAQLASYAQFKEIIKRNFGLEDGIKLHFLASMCSGFVSTVASMPVDIVKTRVQNMAPLADGTMPYKGAADCFGKIVKNEGVFALWKGFTPYYFRLGPHTVLTFIFLEQMNKAYLGK